MGGCTYCCAEADLEALAGPVHQVPEQMISSVAHEVPDHWDDFPGRYRRLAPRIVRLLIVDELDHGLVASRLLAAGRRNWPAPQHIAREEFWHAWWRSVLRTHPSAGQVADVLGTFSVTVGTLAPWLSIRAETPTKAADLHLSDALDHWLVEDELADLHLGFYDEVHATPELLPWLLSLKVRAHSKSVQPYALQPLPHGVLEDRSALCGRLSRVHRHRCQLRMSATPGAARSPAAVCRWIHAGAGSLGEEADEGGDEGGGCGDDQSGLGAQSHGGQGVSGSGVTTSLKPKPRTVSMRSRPTFLRSRYMWTSTTRPSPPHP
ncbi:hypothetical protein GCM10010211_33880 [Streptomyces albospinus]|uniref:Uncharacterized protein n=1 Tax=Streptomyces albospinus TaxID=285515 RepID=A0ABQ2V4K6_9ACTN|nr:hypothetical protein GCM10010211_33880 [Streptomyces albospinus]